MALKGLKTITIDGTVYGVVSDGKPVYEHDDGTDAPFDALGSVEAINARNSEAKQNRLAKEAAEEKLKEASTKLEAFSQIEDPAKALDAINKLKGLDTKQLLEAGEAERMLKERVEAATSALQEQFAPVIEERDKYKASLFGERTTNAFNGSKFLGENVVVPTQMVQATFGSNFKFDDSGNIFAQDANGNTIYSKENPGNAAGFDEAMATLIDQYPHKESILKGSGSSGGGAQDTEGGQSGVRYITRDVMNEPANAAGLRDGTVKIKSS